MKLLDDLLNGNIRRRSGDLIDNMMSSSSDYDVTSQVKKMLSASPGTTGWSGVVRKRRVGFYTATIWSEGKDHEDVIKESTWGFEGVSLEVTLCRSVKMTHSKARYVSYNFPCQNRTVSPLRGGDDSHVSNKRHLPTIISRVEVTSHRCGNDEISTESRKSWRWQDLHG